MPFLACFRRVKSFVVYSAIPDTIFTTNHSRAKPTNIRALRKGAGEYYACCKFPCGISSKCRVKYLRFAKNIVANRTFRNLCLTNAEIFSSKTPSLIRLFLERNLGTSDGMLDQSIACILACVDQGAKQTILQL